jgi:ribonucleotide monophosphatase NagD (HAD superfamily)
VCTETGQKLAFTQARHQYKLYTGLNFPLSEYIKKAERHKTIFCDIDGTIVKHHGNLSKQILEPIELLPETIDTINEWNRAGHIIILVTGRKECTRNITESQLLNAGIFYDQLIMGVGSGDRILINDNKPNNFGGDTAFAINIVRNTGIKDLKL